MQNTFDDLKPEKHFSKFIDELVGAVNKSVPILDVISQDVSEVTNEVVSMLSDLSNTLTNMVITPIIDAIRVVYLANYTIGLAEGVYASINTLISALQDASSYLISVLDRQLAEFNYRLNRFSLMISPIQKVETSEKQKEKNVVELLVSH